jgi:hypothetical protein
MFCAEARTDRLTKLIVALGNFAEEPQNGFSRDRTRGRGLNLVQAKERVACCFECVNEPSVSTKYGEFLE